jgi:hypothetical protein
LFFEKELRMPKYYPVVTAGLIEATTKKFPTARPIITDVDVIDNQFLLACYFLWMLDRLQNFEGPQMMGRRGRWIGYIQRGFENLGVVTNIENRAMTRQDVDAGNE